MYVPHPLELEALHRLVSLAQGNTSQSRRVADFLLAWSAPALCGGFDLTTLWGVEVDVAKDMATVFGLIARSGLYPGQIDPVLETGFEHIAAEWRPELLGGEGR